MENRKPELVDQEQLATSLRPLGIREINERMEVSPLLADQGGMVQGQDWVCCTCKVGPDVVGEGDLPQIMDQFGALDDSDEYWHFPT